MLFKSRKNKYVMDVDVASDGIVECGVKLIMPGSEKNKEEKHEEWIWVNGYKATNRDMTCRDQQYELNKQYDMPEGSIISECESGFHLCLNLFDVFKYYEIGEGHRFFKVSALVRKEDYDKYGTYQVPSGYFFNSGRHIDKLAAKSIIFLQELTVEEIFEYHKSDNFTPEEMNQALEIGVKGVRITKQIIELVNLGLCEAVASRLVNIGKHGIAKDILQQDGMSLDAKMLIIFS